METAAAEKELELSPVDHSPGQVCLTLRDKGRRLSAHWGDAASIMEALEEALASVRASESLGNTTHVELYAGRFLDEIDLTDDRTWKQANANIHRGRFAYEFRLTSDPSVRTQVSPQEVVATNRTLEKSLRLFAEDNQVPAEQERSGGITMRRGKGVSFLINFQQSDLEITRLFRGRQVVELPDVNKESVSQLSDLLHAYLVRSINDDGRMSYLYYPSQGKEDPKRNNSIRQWMATLALVRGSKTHRETERGTLKNIEFNLASSYETDGPFGLIIEDDKVKLGAVAISFLALLETDLAVPDRDELLASLLATMTHLWQDSGQFRTFYRPSWRMDQQNFYSGEALLAWSAWIVESNDKTTLQRFMRSFRFYRDWHLANRNPAFIPWHTQACFRLWKLNQDSDLAEWIFRMNDWLLGMQQWDTAPSPDTRGRFYHPDRPYGPPHASSTGVYLEGLVDAWQLARELNDVGRQEDYRIAIVRGIRSLMQLTFRDDTDMFYVAKRDRLRGGVQTTVYNNTVRIDNVQHNLMALQKIIALSDNFEFDISGGSATPTQCRVAALPANRPPNSEHSSALWTPDELAEATGGRWLSRPKDDWNPIRVSYDVRGLPPGHLIVTKSPMSWGANSQDTSKELDVLAKNGAAGAIVQKGQLDALPELPSDFPLLLVGNTRRTLRKMAEFSRERFSGKVIAVTGTAGKTTSREMLRHVLDPQGGAVANKGNNNNIPGVSRTLCYVPRDHGYAVLEMGFGNPLDGLAISSQIARPHVALLTTLGKAHLDVFSQQQLADTGPLRLMADHKSMIFDGVVDGGTAVVCGDIPELDRVTANARNFGCDVLTFGTSARNDAFLEECEVTPSRTHVKARLNGDRVEWDLGLPGRHMAINSVGVLLAAVAAGADPNVIVERFPTFEAVSGRVRLYTIPAGHGTATLIDDGFNATPLAVQSSLQVLHDVGQQGRTVAVLRDIMHLGPDECRIHAAMADDVVQANVDKVITCGPLMSHLFEALPAVKRLRHTDSLEALYECVRSELQAGDCITIKSGMGTGGLGDLGFRRLSEALRDGRKKL